MRSFLLSLFILLFCGPLLFRLADYEARENDSRLYTKFVQQLGERPMSEMIALKWVPTPYADPDNPYVRDHLIGQFIPSVLLVKLGWDDRYAHYVVNQVYRLFIPFLLFLFFASYFTKGESLLVLIAAHLNTIALNYGLRANQEQALLFSMVLSFFGFFYLKQTKGLALYYASATFGFLIKGLVGLIQYPFWFAYAFFKKDKRKMVHLALLGIFLLVVSALYEWWFREASGYPFWEAYFRIQIFGRSKSGGTPFASLLYYLPRSISYALPWSLGTYFLWRERSKMNSEQKSVLSFLLWNIGGYLLIFGYFSRNASRYIFPVYYLVTCMGALGIGLWFKEKSENLIKKVDPVHIHLLLFWIIFILQYCLFLYKGKTYDGALPS